MLPRVEVQENFGEDENKHCISHSLPHSMRPVDRLSGRSR
jgi:hypothetical protein